MRHKEGVITRSMHKLDLNCEYLASLDRFCALEFNNKSDLFSGFLRIVLPKECCACKRDDPAWVKRQRQVLLWSNRHLKRLMDEDSAWSQHRRDIKLKAKLQAK